MNPRHLVTVAAAIGALVGVVAVYRQHTELQVLQAEATQLQVAPSKTPQHRDRAPLPTPPATLLNEADKLELMRLRAAVAQLLRRQRELAPVLEENAKLKARRAAAGPPASGGVTAPPGWTRRRDAQFAGVSTPEASLQSLFWAIEHQDTNRLMQLHTPASIESLQRMLDQEGSKGLWDQLRIVVGYRIVGREARSEDEIVLKVEILPGEPPQDMTVRRLDNEWKFDL